MAIYLDEDMVGTDANMIAFPHLVLCMGLVVSMRDGSLIGAHFSTPETEDVLLRLMADQIRKNGSGMDQLVCMADIAVHVNQFGGGDINAKAEALGFKGSGNVVDFGVLKPTSGTYAQVTATGVGQRPQVRCRLNQDMTYTYVPGANVMQVKPIANGQGLRVTQKPSNVTGAVANYLSTPFLKSVTI